MTDFPRGNRFGNRPRDQIPTGKLIFVRSTSHGERGFMRPFSHGETDRARFPPDRFPTGKPIRETVSRSNSRGEIDFVRSNSHGETGRVRLPGDQIPTGKLIAAQMRIASAAVMPCCAQSSDRHQMLRFTSEPAPLYTFASARSCMRSSSAWAAIGSGRDAFQATQMSRRAGTSSGTIARLYAQRRKIKAGSIAIPRPASTMAMIA